MTNRVTGRYYHHLQVTKNIAPSSSSTSSHHHSRTPHLLELLLIAITTTTLLRRRLLDMFSYYQSDKLSTSAMYSLIRAAIGLIEKKSSDTSTSQWSRSDEPIPRYNNNNNNKNTHRKPITLLRSSHIIYDHEQRADAVGS